MKATEELILDYVRDRKVMTCFVRLYLASDRVWHVAVTLPGEDVEKPRTYSTTIHYDGEKTFKHGQAQGFCDAIVHDLRRSARTVFTSREAWDNTEASRAQQDMANLQTKYGIITFVKSPNGSFSTTSIPRDQCKCCGQAGSHAESCDLQHTEYGKGVSAYWSMLTGVDILLAALVRKGAIHWPPNPAILVPALNEVIDEILADTEAN